MLALGAAGLLILVLGLVVFLRFAPLGQRTGLAARVIGVYAYDPVQRTVAGPAATRFPRTQPFAARVSWASLPSGVVVGATWYDSLQDPARGRRRPGARARPARPAREPARHLHAAGAAVRGRPAGGDPGPDGRGR